MDGVLEGNDGRQEDMTQADGAKVPDNTIEKINAAQCNNQNGDLCVIRWNRQET